MAKSSRASKKGESINHLHSWSSGFALLAVAVAVALSVYFVLPPNTDSRTNIATSTLRGDKDHQDSETRELKDELQLAVDEKRDTLGAAEHTFSVSFVRAFTEFFFEATADLDKVPSAGAVGSDQAWLNALKRTHDHDRHAHYAMIDEKVTVDALVAAAATIDTDPGRQAADRLRMLRAALGDLRTNEAAYEALNPDRGDSMARASQATGQDAASFTYGSTPYPTFLQLWQRPVVKAAVKATKEADRSVVVLGSSTGWLPLYAGLTSNVHSEGHELLQFRAATAQKIKMAHLDKDAQDLVTFTAGDAKDADISNAGVIWLTSLVWPRALVSAIHTKIATECAEGAVVVSNTDLPELFQSGLFERLDLVRLPVSWGSTQTFVVYRFIHDAAKRVRKDHVEEDLPEPEQVKPKARTTAGGMVDALGAELQRAWVGMRIRQLGSELAGEDGTEEGEGVDVELAERFAEILGRFRKQVAGEAKEDEESTAEYTELMGACDYQMLFFFVKRDVYAKRVGELLTELPSMRACFDLLDRTDGTTAHDQVITEVNQKIRSGYFE